jgi:hypothetical protein
MGHRSRSPGKPCTPGCGLTAKAPSLRKDQYKGTQRTRKAVHGECSVELVKWTFPIISLSREPYEAKVCAAVRGTASLTPSREVRRETSGPSDVPEGASWRGQAQVGKAGGTRRRVWCRPARPACEGASDTACIPSPSGGPAHAAPPRLLAMRSGAARSPVARCPLRLPGAR